jgi:hypothetical protein
VQTGDVDVDVTRNVSGETANLEFVQRLHQVAAVAHAWSHADEDHRHGHGHLLATGDGDEIDMRRLRRGRLEVHVLDHALVRITVHT